MVVLELLRTLRGHTGAIWSILWSFSGNFIISAGVDSSLIFWGPSNKLIEKKIYSKFSNEKFYFKSWHKIYRLKIFQRLRTFRSLAKKINSNYFSISDFKGQSYLWEIVFIKRNKICLAEIKHVLRGPFSEIKTSSFSFDEILFSSGGRDKSIWIWKNNFRKKIDCDFIFRENKSDIKCLKWNPLTREIVNATYEGSLLFTIYAKRASKIIEVKNSNSTVWSIFFDETGKKLFYGNGIGEVVWVNLINRSSCDSKKKFNIKKALHIEILGFFLINIDCIHSIVQATKNSLYLIGNSIGVLDILKKQRINKKAVLKNFDIFKKKKAFLLKPLAKIPTLHFGKINSITWHPIFDNIFMSCGNDSIINIWKVF